MTLCPRQPINKMFKAKILVVGPCESGKTWISNFLAEATESSGGEYHPTQGVRILEFESEGEDPSTSKPFRAEVELWDCSGSKRFENCWPAFWKDTNGVLLVYNPDKPHQERDLERWYTHFVSQQNLRDDQCLVFAHHKPSAPEVPHQHPTSERLSGVQCVHTNLEQDPDTVREEFSNFLVGLITSWKDRQDQEELGIVSMQN